MEKMDAGEMQMHSSAPIEIDETISMTTKKKEEVVRFAREKFGMRNTFSVIVVR